jgi:cytochrome c-type biogenesis protein CcmF
MADRLWLMKGVMVVVSSVILVWLIMNHRFEYFYVWNYTSTDLEPLYLFSALWGGQEGSFMVWIFMGFLVGTGSHALDEDPYKEPVMFVMALRSCFSSPCFSDGIFFGYNWERHRSGRLYRRCRMRPFCSPIRILYRHEGTGLNDLLQSPWMAIHPPIIFVGFAMMTVPFAFAIASLWKTAISRVGQAGDAVDS